MRPAGWPHLWIGLGSGLGSQGVGVLGRPGASEEDSGGHRLGPWWSRGQQGRRTASNPVCLGYNPGAPARGLQGPAPGHPSPPSKKGHIPTPRLIFFLFLLLLIFLIFIFIFERERDRQSVSGGRAERGRHRIGSRLQAPRCQHRARHGARTHELRDHDLSRSRRLSDCAIQAPLFFFSVFFFF